MDPTEPVGTIPPLPDAATPPSAAVTPPGQEGYEPPVQQAAPDAAGTPPTDTGTTEPPIDWQAQARQEAAARQAAERQNAEIQQMLQQAAYEAQEQQARQESENRRAQMYQMAQGMDSQSATEFIRRFEDQERASLHQTVQAIRQQAQQQTYAAVARVAAPLYAQDLAKQHNLPPEYAEELAQLPPDLMDRMLPSIKQRAARDRAIYTELQNLKRDQNAAQMQATGAYTVGGGTGVPVTATSRITPGSPDYDSKEHLRQIFADNGVAVG